MTASCLLGPSTLPPAGAPPQHRPLGGRACKHRALPGAAVLRPPRPLLLPGVASATLANDGPHSGSSSNGAGDISAHDGPAAAHEPLAAGRSTPAERHERGLRDELAELRELVLQQGRVIQQQQETIRLLERLHLGGGAQQQQQREREQPGGGAGALEQLRRQQRGLSERLQGVADGGRGELGDSSLGIVEPAIGDRRMLGCYDARYHSTHSGATPRDFRLLPRRIVLVRHAQSEGNVDNFQYTYVPDPKVPLTARGWEQALDAGEKLKAIMDADGKPYKLFFYTSPYLRSKQTYEGLIQAFKPDQLIGVQEEVQLREQEFGNFQDAEGKTREKAERLRFGRFFYRFPNGESGADVYDRMTIFEDHLVRDINAGRYGYDSSLVLVTHGLAARIFLMRWFHWTTDQFMNVFNPPNAEPIVMERVTTETESRQGGPASWIHTKALYRLTDCSMDKLVGCTEDMCSTSWLPRGIDSPREYSSH